MNEMTSLDKELLMIEANHLIENYGLSYGQISRYIQKHYGWFVHRQTIYRWLN